MALLTTPQKDKKKMKTKYYAMFIPLSIVLTFLLNPLNALDNKPEFIYNYPSATCNCIEQKVDGTNNGCSIGTVDLTCGYCEGWGCYPGEDNWRSACNAKYGKPEYGWYIPPGSATNTYHQPSGCGGYMCGEIEGKNTFCPANGEPAPPCPPAPNNQMSH